jgi:hypothetical protein
MSRPILQCVAVNTEDKSSNLQIFFFISELFYCKFPIPFENWQRVGIHWCDGTMLGEIMDTVACDAANTVNWVL